MDKNIYFVLIAKSREQAKAIAEAADLAKYHNAGAMPVEVRECGTKRLIASVYPSGDVTIEGK